MSQTEHKKPPIKTAGPNTPPNKDRYDSQTEKLFHFIRFIYKANVQLQQQNPFQALLYLVAALTHYHSQRIHTLILPNANLLIQQGLLFQTLIVKQLKSMFPCIQHLKGSPLIKKATYFNIAFAIITSASKPSQHSRAYLRKLEASFTDKKQETLTNENFSTRRAALLTTFAPQHCSIQESQRLPHTKKMKKYIDKLIIAYLMLPTFSDNQTLDLTKHFPKKVEIDFEDKKYKTLKAQFDEKITVTFNPLILNKAITVVIQANLDYPHAAFKNAIQAYQALLQPTLQVMTNKIKETLDKYTPSLKKTLLSSYQNFGNFQAAAAWYTLQNLDVCAYKQEKQPLPHAVILQRRLVMLSVINHAMRQGNTSATSFLLVSGIAETLYDLLNIHLQKNMQARQKNAEKNIDASLFPSKKEQPFLTLFKEIKHHSAILSVAAINRAASLNSSEIIKKPRLGGDLFYPIDVKNLDALKKYRNLKYKNEVTPAEILLVFKCSSE